MVSTAVQKVFGTAELSEAIFLELSFTQLFAMQRTCKIFQASIKESRVLQRKMFLLPEKNSDQTANDFLFNPILNEDTFNTKLVSPAPLYRNSWGRHSRTVPTPEEVQINWTDGARTKVGTYFDVIVEWSPVWRIPSGHVLPLTMRSTDTWRNMLISQPPLNVFQPPIENEVQIKTPPSPARRSVRLNGCRAVESGGVTFGTLMEWLEDEREPDPLPEAIEWVPRNEYGIEVCSACRRAL